MQKVERVNLSELKIHPLVSGIINNALYAPIQYSLQNYGQKSPIVVVKRGDSYLVIDGVHRYKAAVELDSINTLNCKVLDIDDDEVIDTRIIYNQKSKMHILEKCIHIEHRLGSIVSNQGKRNDLLKKKNFDKEDESTVVEKGRFERACMESDLPFSLRTIYKLMEVHYFEKNDDSLGLIDGIDSGKYKIDAAFKLMKSSIAKSQKKNDRKKIEIERVTSDVWFKVYEQSATDLSNLKSLKPKFAMFSPTYWGMKKYRNQGEMLFGQEPTLLEYIDNCRKFIDGLIEIMDKNGVIVVVIGESYKGGYKSITSQYEMMLLNAGLEILGVCEWVKSNTTPVVVNNFFRPANEKIFVCKMKGAEVTFNPKMTSTKDGEKSVKKSQKAKDGSQRYFVQDDERIISNIITTAGFNKSEFKKYDPDFTHDAPCPMEIYDIFVSSYTLSGDTCIDIHCGSGQGLESFLRHGCNAVGVDIDPVSIEFCNKRMSMVLGQEDAVELQIAA